MNDTQKEKELLKLYATLPKLDCKRLCQECCGPFAMSRLELKRMERVTGKLKCDLISPIYTETAQRFVGLARTLNQPTCPLLKDGLCSVYETRPGICRLWGLTERLKCPFGCQPERVLSEAEAFYFMSQVFQIGF